MNSVDALLPIADRSGFFNNERYDRGAIGDETDKAGKIAKNPQKRGDLCCIWLLTDAHCEISGEFVKQRAGDIFPAVSLTGYVAYC